MNTTTITLHYPVKIDGVEIKTLEYVRPTGEDLLKVEGKTTSPLDADFHLYAQQCSVPLSLIYKMDAVDIDQLHKEYARIPAPLSDTSTPEQQKS
ncbi:phage tail assembly protein [Maridesulfovibrio sp.]|uniref:phage tail assembly protein n=1 Tax=Maridesulfovibrio sp. TaxID=2795000 RepID=UPI0029CA5852|nr:phage tail assembly protein [Maridesulfovibrio sp.]